jgi:Tol biopolymer transport system component
LYEKPVIGDGNATLVWSSSVHKFPEDWSSDGRFVLFQTGGDQWVLPLEGDRTPRPVARTRFDELNGRFSPDGRFIAYESNESGRFEIYVQPFPGVGPRSKISVDGGTSPQWREDGGELYYLSADNHLIAVPLSSRRSVVIPGKAENLFAMPQLPGNQEFRSVQHYAAARDGQRFLAYRMTADAPPITLVLNWKPPVQH